MEQKSEDSAVNAEDKLHDLLDSCLDDFNKPIPQTSAKSSELKTSESTKLPEATLPEGAAWSEEFKEFSEVLENCFANGPEMEEMRKLVDNCFARDGSGPDDETFMKSFAESIQQMTEQAQNIPDTSPDDIANLLGSLGMSEGSVSDGEGIPEIMPLMQSVMQKLMSKELLYPSIKEVVEKYPAWLDEKKPLLDTVEHERYRKQYELMKKICEEFERELDPTEAAQKQQFDVILQLMQKVQTFGNPPKELVANIESGIPLDDKGNLQIPGMPEQCSIM